MLSWLVPIFKEKVDPINPNSYRGIKLLEHGFELYEMRRFWMGVCVTW